MDWGAVSSWTWISVGATLAGVALTAVGIRQTWKAYAQGRQFWGPYRALLVRARGRIAALWRWAYNIQPKPVHHTGEAHLAVAWAGTVKGEMGPLPALDDPLFWTNLDMRLRGLHDRLQRVDGDLATERTERTDAVDALRDDLTGKVDTVHTKVAEVAVDGLRFQLRGLFLIVFGQVAQVMDAVTSAAG